MNKPNLVNVVERETQIPGIFNLPDTKSIQDVSVTDNLKVRVEDGERRAESFFVSVMKVNIGKDGVESFDCFVDNDLLIYAREFPYQAPINVLPNNVVALY